VHVINIPQQLKKTMNDQPSANPTQPQKNDRLIWWIIGITVLVIGGSVLWHKVLKDQFVAKRWGQVETGLYRSGQLSTGMCEPTLKDNNIQVIINLCSAQPNDPEDVNEKQVAQELGIDREHFPMPGDGTGTLEAYVAAETKLITSMREKKNTLVHCSAGTQRTGGVIASYRLLVEGAKPQDILKEMQQYDFSTKSNPKLLPHLNAIMPELAKRLKERGMIDTIPDPIPTFPE
jgi:protein-tyrosine phosphatase